MRPEQLKPADFAAYPPLAKALAVQQLELLRVLPLSFLPLLLREVIGYDWKFPVERKELDDQFTYLQSYTSLPLQQLLAPFAELKLSAGLSDLDWISDPAQFSEKLSAHLWATHQMDAFRTASIDYVHGMKAAHQTPAPLLPRLSIVLIGQQAQAPNHSLFRKLKVRGKYYSNVQAENGLAAALAVVKQRAADHPAPFAHWYIDGNKQAAALPNTITCISYQELADTRVALVNKMIKTMQPGGGGPEVLRTELAQLQPKDLGLSEQGDDAVLSRFKLGLLTQGSGTQIFSTTFVQWTAREVLRRAQPSTLLVRFTPRQRDATVRNLEGGGTALDPDASLVDADMGAYYTWLNQGRLSDAARSRFLAWFEDHKQALIIGPDFPAGTVEESSVTLRDLLARLA